VLGIDEVVSTPLRLLGGQLHDSSSTISEPFVHRFSFMRIRPTFTGHFGRDRFPDYFCRFRASQQSSLSRHFFLWNRVV